ncbi:hypothetical protein ACJMK2_031430 [Sinanodonta woodiana]|uniref:Uncharacterized protein n=1 Tax=Sinanodonta woodiana TaxID=1069815 RepID=A0ABD3X2R6_SINWO
MSQRRDGTSVWTPSESNKKPLLQNLQDMFGQKIDYEVIHIVLAESDWKVEQAADRLLSMLETGLTPDRENWPALPARENALISIAKEVLLPGGTMSSSDSNTNRSHLQRQRGDEKSSRESSQHRETSSKEREIDSKKMAAHYQKEDNFEKYFQNQDSRSASIPKHSPLHHATSLANDNEPYSVTRSAAVMHNRTSPLPLSARGSSNSRSTFLSDASPSTISSTVNYQPNTYTSSNVDSTLTTDKFSLNQPGILHSPLSSNWVYGNNDICSGGHVGNSSLGDFSCSFSSDSAISVDGEAECNLSSSDDVNRLFEQYYSTMGQRYTLPGNDQEVQKDRVDDIRDKTPMAEIISDNSTTKKADVKDTNAKNSDTSSNDHSGNNTVFDHNLCIVGAKSESSSRVDRKFPVRLLSKSPEEGSAFTNSVLQIIRNGITDVEPLDSGDLDENILKSIYEEINEKKDELDVKALPKKDVLNKAAANKGAKNPTDLTLSSKSVTPTMTLPVIGLSAEAPEFVPKSKVVSSGLCSPISDIGSTPERSNTPCTSPLVVPCTSPKVAPCSSPLIVTAADGPIKHFSGSPVFITPKLPGTTVTTPTIHAPRFQSPGFLQHHSTLFSQPVMNQLSFTTGPPIFQVKNLAQPPLIPTSHPPPLQHPPTLQHPLPLLHPPPLLQHPPVSHLPPPILSSPPVTHSAIIGGNMFSADSSAPISTMDLNDMSSRTVSYSAATRACPSTKKMKSFHMKQGHLSSNPKDAMTSPLIHQYIQIVKEYKDKGVKLLIILRGLPGSGKTTLARILNLDGMVLSSDDFFVQGDKYEFDRTRLAEIHQKNKDRAKAEMRKGTNPIIIDNTNTQSWEIKPYITMGVHHGYHVEIWEPDTPWRYNPKECAKHNNHGVSVEQIRRMLDRYQHNLTMESIFQGRGNHSGNKTDDQSSVGYSMIKNDRSTPDESADLENGHYIDIISPISTRRNSGDFIHSNNDGQTQTDAEHFPQHSSDDLTAIQQQGLWSADSWEDLQAIGAGSKWKQTKSFDTSALSCKKEESFFDRNITYDNSEPIKKSESKENEDINQYEVWTETDDINFSSNVVKVEETDIDTFHKSVVSIPMNSESHYEEKHQMSPVVRRPMTNALSTPILTTAAKMYSPVTKEHQLQIEQIVADLISEHVGDQVLSEKKSAQMSEELKALLHILPISDENRVYAEQVIDQKFKCPDNDVEEDSSVDKSFESMDNGALQMLEKVCRNSEMYELDKYDQHQKNDEEDIKRVEVKLECANNSKTTVEMSEAERQYWQLSSANKVSENWDFSDADEDSWKGNPAGENGQESSYYIEFCAGNETGYHIQDRVHGENVQRTEESKKIKPFEGKAEIEFAFGNELEAELDGRSIWEVEDQVEKCELDEELEKELKKELEVLEEISCDMSFDRRENGCKMPVNCKKDSKCEYERTNGEIKDAHAESQIFVCDNAILPTEIAEEIETLIWSDPKPRRERKNGGKDKGILVYQEKNKKESCMLSEAQDVVIRGIEHGDHDDGKSDDEKVLQLSDREPRPFIKDTSVTEYNTRPVEDKYASGVIINKMFDIDKNQSEVHSEMENHSKGLTENQSYSLDLDSQLGVYEACETENPENLEVELKSHTDYDCAETLQLVEKLISELIYKTVQCSSITHIHDEADSLVSNTSGMHKEHSTINNLEADTGIEACQSIDDDSWLSFSLAEDSNSLLNDIQGCNIDECASDDSSQRSDEKTNDPIFSQEITESIENEDMVSGGADLTKQPEQGQNGNRCSKSKMKKFRRKMAANLPFLEGLETQKFLNTNWNDLIQLENNVARLPLADTLSSGTKTTTVTKEQGTSMESLDFRLLNLSAECADIENYTKEFTVVLCQPRDIFNSAEKLRTVNHVSEINHILKVDRSCNTEEENGEEGLDFIRGCFPTIPPKEILEAFETSGKNVDWTISYLLDWQSNPFLGKCEDTLVDSIDKPDIDKPLISLTVSGPSGCSLKSPNCLQDLCISLIEKKHIVSIEDIEKQLIVTGKERLNRIEDDNMKKIKFCRSRSIHKTVTNKYKLSKDVIGSRIQCLKAENSPWNGDIRTTLNKSSKISLGDEKFSTECDNSDLQMKTFADTLDEIKENNLVTTNIISSSGSNNSELEISLRDNDDNRGNKTDMIIQNETSDYKRDLPKENGLSNLYPADDDIHSPDKEPIMYLPVSSELVQSLEALFGPLGGSSTDRRKQYHIPIDWTTAETLHQCLRRELLLQDEAIASELSGHLKRGEDARKSPAKTIWRRLDQERMTKPLHWEMKKISSLSQNYWPLSLQEIMEEEARKEQEKDEQRKLMEITGEASVMATTINRKLLYERFSGIDPSFLDELFESKLYNYEETVKLMETVVSPLEAQTSVTTNEKERERQMLERVKQESLHEMLDSYPYQPKVTKDFQEPEGTDYEDYRGEAHIHFRLRHECFQKAQEAYKRGMKQVASFYSQQGHLHSQKINEANARAANRIMEERSTEVENLSVLNLHDLHVDEAITTLARILPEKELELQLNPDRRKQHILIITGRGSHSRGGIAKIRPAVERYLRKNNYSFTEQRAGAFKVLLKYRATAS